ncbi:class I SAM-dependent methyltransferase [Legionella bononiensis]|uniref:Ribosomal RNA small subunit methyltransferase J n=1 Tax=Legionella bononiensis TaxID=2793102 RepID=A0ABS1WCZ2_9GAMM|nr:class I SAM-dependent methyltransferase [Legionella bononiensis]MBL7479090.1 class I SAM-dependent methyltransferase [Legionella bononiensis]MBL7527223.1 class I SAM-dependent methyltransferase [Legionella bononiensis]MBL7562192.1 class I SAM-dependent methyltransferase [Legionella bononiensis]
MSAITTVGYESEELREEADLLAKQLDFTLDKEAATCLYVTSHKLALKIPNFSLLSADFSASTWNKRRSEGKKQGLIRACKPAQAVKILDATAGWGRDAAILASFGAQVVMLERNPIMAALLSDAISHQNDLDKQKLKVSLYAADARLYLNNLADNDFPDVIYIDPMHPQRNKSALVKKDMQVLQQMIGTDEDALDLMQVAISHAKQRVVVKWPQKVKALLEPDTSIEGKTVRFDVYINKKS